jgi:tripartite-type tricarboxylate transporter receptor subunit TctC
MKMQEAAMAVRFDAGEDMPGAVNGGQGAHGPRRRWLKQAGRSLATLALVSSAAAAFAPAAQAQDRPLKIIVGAPAGGTTDTLARTMSDVMGQVLKRPVVVENKAGAGGNIAADIVARSKPDGDTILMSFTGHTINATLYKKLPFDPIKDFTPITMVATVPSVLIANSNVPVNDTAELIAYAKKNPGKLNFAIGATGSSLHMAGEQFKMKSGADIVNVPYKGTGPALTDVLAGQVELMFASTINVLPHLQGGKIKVLGVTSAEPMKQFPGVKTIGATIEGFESNAWFGLFGPAGLPAEVAARLHEAARAAVESPSFQSRLEADGARPVTMEPQAFADFVVQDVKRWAEVIRFSGATVE